MSSTTPADAAYLRALAAGAGVPFVSLIPGGAGDRLEQVNPLAARLLSEQACRNFCVVPVAYSDGVVTIATADPLDSLAQNVCGALLGRSIGWVVAAPEEIMETIGECFLAAPDGAGEPQRESAPQDMPTRSVDDLVRLGIHEHLRIGEMLLLRSIVTPELVEEACAEHRRTGSRVGEILVHNGAVAERDLIGALAEQLQIPLVDVSDLDPQSLPRDVIPEPLARHLRCVPIGMDERCVYLAIAEPLDNDTIAALREHTHLELRGFLATANSIDELLQRIHGSAYVDAATSELLSRLPEECANRVLSESQRVGIVLGLVASIALLVFFPIPTLVAFVGLASLFYTAASFYKFWLMYSALGHEYEVGVSAEEVRELDERGLPRYTILVPLYREANVVPRLVKAIEALDYPKTKLDVRLLCEQEDEETVAVIRSLGLAPHFKLVIVPPSSPQTKPKACNFGLLHADGEIVVIFDAEDRPDPDQLKKIVAAFRKTGPRVTCIQAKLNFFNQEQNLLTRWFSTEYAMWFELILPGLDAQNVPIPLGGTSNHFLRDRLVSLGAWDPFNVTEDADLGIRLHKAGYQTAIIDSTTLEEANSELNNWIRQRSRWIKGYIQTWLVHMRHPVRLFRQLGAGSFISFQLLVGGSFIFLLNPIFWLLTTVFFFTHAGLIQQVFPSFVFYAAAFQLFIGNFAFMYLNMAGAVERGYFALAKYALFSPLYWGLMSIAAWKGFIQLFTRPFYWEKTEHGLDVVPQPASAAPREIGQSASPTRERPRTDPQGSRVALPNQA
jgi:cellulose synthase/poly-beta-1,6-N-acetylglucosamine synthase-like glycosyltransferase